MLFPGWMELIAQMLYWTLILLLLLLLQEQSIQIRTIQ